MRSLTSTIVLLVVLGGLVGYIYYDRDRTPGAEAAKAKAFDVSPENIVEVQVKTPSGGTARVERINTSWQVVEPEKADADPTEVAAVTSSLAGLEVQRVVDENPGDVAQYGLNPPKIEVAFRVKDQKDFHRLLVGEKTPTGNDVYARTPDQKRVFLISSFLETTFNKTAFNFRDKAILKFDRDKADAIEIVDATNALAFARQNAEWRLVKPIAARADYAAVEALLQRLSSAHMQKIVAPAASDLKQYGLDTPHLQASVGTGSSRATLLIGEPDVDGNPVAKDQARPTVFTVEQSLIADFSKDAGEFRRKDVFDFRSFTANRIELRRDAATQVLEKTKGTDGKETWKDAAGKTIDQAKVEDLLTKLTNVRAQSFEAAPHASLKMPALTVVARFDDSKTETVTFGRAGSDVYAGRADEPGSAKVEAGPFDDAVKALDGLK
jgi:hypothetical protein